ncbi:MAG: hypothetical protein M1840_009151 [Geoglossum simile]|nr:MAG: hypothetical protein M1840_009151 [Geoglossum simile]
MKKVRVLNGSGRSGSNTSLERTRRELGVADREVGTIPMTSIHAVTVPGAAAGWMDTVEKFGNGRLSMEQILAPAIELAEKGFPVSELTSVFSEHGCRAPLPGELFKNSYLANTPKRLAQLNKKGFYEGSIAEAIVKVVQERGGYLSMDDLKKANILE